MFPARTCSAIHRAEWACGGREGACADRASLGSWSALAGCVIRSKLLDLSEPLVFSFIHSSQNEWGYSNEQSEKVKQIVH